MSTLVVLAVAVPVLVVLGALVLQASTRRRDTDDAVGRLSRETRRADRSRSEALAADAEPAPTGRDVERSARQGRRVGAGVALVDKAKPPATYVPPDPETIGVTRRQFLNRSIVNFFGLGLAAFGAASLAFIWPSATGGFGSKIRVGAIPDVKARIRDGNGFLYVPEGKMWVTEYPETALSKAQAVYSEPELAGMEVGLVALFQKCPHLGCRVPECETSQWFECPCHGSQYNQAGEKKGGPAPRGMDRFAMSVEDNAFFADTGVVIPGPPIGVNTTGQEAEGPHCLGSAEG